LIDFKKLLEKSVDDQITISILVDMQDRKIIEDLVQDGKVWIKTTTKGKEWFKVLNQIDEN